MAVGCMYVPGVGALILVSEIGRDLRERLLSCRAFIDPRNLCGSPWPGSLSYLLTLFLGVDTDDISATEIFTLAEECKSH